ncbi:MAG: hypothetical protein EXS29_00425 [Pedosphaera sp.]|nr:hypothetical protein [Pedosphaera sp.]
MSDPSQLEKNEAPGGNQKAASAESSSSNNPLFHEEKPPRKLTPEEQMDLYEKDLKETDWGHQPC